jgi:hypothetical protein
MLARVKNVRSCTREETKEHQDDFFYGMKKKKLIEVSPIKGQPDWYYHDGYHYHKNWLEFNIETTNDLTILKKWYEEVLAINFKLTNENEQLKETIEKVKSLLCQHS